MLRLYDYREDYSRSYWKLESGSAWMGRDLRNKLREKNFAVLKSTKMPRLRELYTRSQRGLLSYESMPLRELKSYVAQRALPVVAHQKATQAILKARLEKADDDATFDHFLDLPPELRQTVFAHHFDWLNDQLVARRRLENKAQPPITLVSRDTRRESLPLFYERCEFTINMYREKHSLNNCPCPMSKVFIKSNACNFARVKLLCLNIRMLNVRIVMDLRNRDNPLRLVHAPSANQTKQEQLSSDLRTVIMGMATRDGPLKLRPSDLDELGTLVKNSYAV